MVKPIGDFFPPEETAASVDWAAVLNKPPLAPEEHVHAVATPSLNGLMSSADKVKLDAMPLIILSSTQPVGVPDGTIWVYLPE